MINEGVRRAYNHPDNMLRASIVNDPAFDRKNTKDNTPAVIHMEVVPGDELDIAVAAKGGGSENKAKLDHAESVGFHRRLAAQGRAAHGRRLVPAGHARHRHRRHRREGDGAGEGIAVRSHRHSRAVASAARKNKIEELRLEIMDKVNALGIGAQGLGGLTTVLDVKIKDYPTHAASLPVAMIPNCAATRHAHFVLDGSGPAKLEAPRSEAVAEAHVPGIAPIHAREPGRADARRRRVVAAGRTSAAVGQDADRPRRRSQAHSAS